MQKYSTIKYCSLVFCVFLVFAEMTSSVPFYSDDENDLAGSNREKDYQIRNKSIELISSVMLISVQLRTFGCHYDIRDLYELLLKKKALDDQLSQTHQISRKSNRSPSLRLRFGKKRDPYYANPPLIAHPVHVLEELDNL